jgi:signal transduction histidine kinase
MSDTGQGISLDFLPFVFDLFQQADGSTTRRHGGLGLEPSVVRYLVEAHSGSVRVTALARGRARISPWICRCRRL